MDFKIPQNTVRRLSRHDVVYGSPLCDALAGMPIGDGDTGSLIWLEEDGLHININKTDLWEDSTWNDECFCSEKEENLSCLRHGGELIIKLNSPCFDFTYQKEFEGRLRLSDATANIRSQTAFSDINVTALASNENKVSLIKFTRLPKEEDCVEITFKRYGSKNSWRWYAMTYPAPDNIAEGTEVSLKEKQIFITQQLNGTVFCLGLSLVCADSFSIKRINSHSGKIFLDNPGEFILYYNVSLGVNRLDAEGKCLEILKNAEKKGFDAIYYEHKSAWADFWNRSYINLPDDYIENLWYLSLYYSQSECRGAYPPHFTSGIWGFKHDFLPWTHYFHYNMQHMYAPLDASGHGELIENYYKMRRAALPVAEKCARTIKNKKGAFYHDVSDYSGKCASSEGGNCTPGAQIAMAMFHHYRMNGDVEFLKNVALPIMKSVSEFYLDMLTCEEDGIYRIYGTTAYEGTPLFDDTVTDYVMIKALFGALISLDDELVKNKDLYEKVLNNLPDYLYTLLENDEVDENGFFKVGIGNGSHVFGDGEVLAVGKSSDGRLMRRTVGDAQKAFYGFPDTEMSPVYPAGIIGIKDKGTRAYNAIANSMMIHGEPEECMQWCMMPQYIARMGFGEMLFPYLRKVVNDWQTFPNGMGADCKSGITEARERFRYHHPFCRDTEMYTYQEAFYFRHLDMEMLPIVASAVNEALLQSYDGVIRILPAIIETENVAFTLYAEGGFRISCQWINGSFTAKIESLRGEECTVILPDFVKNVTGRKNGNEEIIFKGNTLRLNLDKNETVVLSNGICARDDIYEDRENMMWKTCGKAFLGTPPIIDFVLKTGLSQEGLLEEIKHVNIKN